MGLRGGNPQTRLDKRRPANSANGASHNRSFAVGASTAPAGRGRRHRRHVLGRRGDRLADPRVPRVQLVAALRQPEEDVGLGPARVTRLCGWGWLLDAFQSLPTSAPLAASP